MCGIVDADIAFEIFGDRDKQTEAGKKFLDWIGTGTRRLVVGGQLLQELNRTGFGGWARQAINSGMIWRVRETEVAKRAEDLRRAGSCKSNDPHVIALAQVSGARLLYTGDDKLKRDFRNSKLIYGPQGKIYPARDKRFHNGSFEKVHHCCPTKNTNEGGPEGLTCVKME